MGRSRNGRNRRHNCKYIYRNASKKEKQRKVAEQIIKKEIFVGEMLPAEKPKVLTKIGDKWVVS